MFERVLFTVGTILDGSSISTKYVSIEGLITIDDATFLNHSLLLFPLTKGTQSLTEVL